MYSDVKSGQVGEAYSWYVLSGWQLPHEVATISTTVPGVAWYV